MEIMLSEPAPKNGPVSARAGTMSVGQITSSRVHGLIQRRDSFTLSTTTAIFAEFHDVRIADSDDSNILCATNTLLQRLLANEVQISQVRD